MTLKHTHSPRLLGQHAVVIGASMAGLLAARVLSESFERVTLIERDRLEGMGPRKGVPQGWQTHALLNKGAAVIEALFPDLVVDASGRGSQAPHWLKTLGYPQVEEAVVKVNVGYTTRTYRRPKELPADWKILVIYCTPPQEQRTGLVQPIEGDRWSVSLSGWLKDYPPSDEAGFLEYAHSLPNPALHELIKEAEPLTTAISYRFAANRRRYYERMSRFPEGFVVLGDALCSFNPVYAQGMTVAAIEVEMLQTCLQQRQQRQKDLTGLPRQFQKAVARTVSAAWMFTTSEDFRYPATEGKRPLGIGLFQWYTRRLLEAAAEIPELALRFYHVMHMLKPPTTLFAPRVLAAVLFRRKAALPIRDKLMVRPKQPGDVEEWATSPTPVEQAHR